MYSKMGSADLPEPAGKRQQNSYTYRSSAPNSSSVMLIYARRVSAKLTHRVKPLWYRGVNEHKAKIKL
jgi:hypothetical protein